MAVKITFSDFDRLLGVLSDLAVVAEDSLSNEETKNIIFSVSESGVKLIAINQLITYKKNVDESFCSVSGSSDGVTMFQVPSKDFSGFLSSYKGLRQTKVTEVSMSLMDNNRVLCEVCEVPKDSGFAEAPTISKRVFMMRPIKDNLKPFIELSLPEDSKIEAMESRSLKFFTSSLLPNMANDTSLFGHLIFGEDYVVSFSAAYTTMMRNFLAQQGVFTGVKMGYRAISFIDKVLCLSGTLEVAKLERHIYFKTDFGEAFVGYDTRLADYSAYIGLFASDHAFTLDRRYFKDVLRRVDGKDSLMLSVRASDNVMQVSNTLFSQDIGLMQVKDMESFGTVSFKVMPDVLNHVIIGSDEEFPGELVVYYNPQQGNSAAVIFTDLSRSWMSVVKVSILRNRV